MGTTGDAAVAYERAASFLKIVSGKANAPMPLVVCSRLALHLLSSRSSRAPGGHFGTRVPGVARLVRHRAHTKPCASLRWGASNSVNIAIRI